MNGLYIYKTLAYANELRTVESSEDEFQEFLMGVARPDFADRDVICVRFLFSISPDCLDDAEEISWFINPNSIKAPPYCVTDSYGSKLPNDYPPYILLFVKDYPDENLLWKYDVFFDTEIDHNWRTDYAHSHAAFAKWCSDHL